VESQKTRQRRFFRLRTQLAIGFSAMAITIAVAITVTLYLDARNKLFEEFRQRVTDMVSIAALQQDSELHATLVAQEQQDSAAYQKIQATNKKIIATEPIIGSIYTLRQDKDGTIRFIVDAVSPDLEKVRLAAPLNAIYASPGSLLAENFSSITKPVAEESTYTDGWGTWLSAYAPIYRADGTREAILGLDISAEAVLAAQKNLLNTALTILAILLPIIAIIGWLLGNNQARPIGTLAQAANQIAAGEFGHRVEISTNIIEVAELAKDFNAMTDTISSLVGNLENRVTERTDELAQRTTELETLSARNQRRAAQLEAIAEISRAIVSVRSLDTMLPQITGVIADQFNFYHVGIFLLDETRQYAVLSAANSVGGRRLLERQHKLRVGGIGIVGYVTATGTARIALDTGLDAAFFNNPDLPDTHSEIALPLIARNQIFGALDVQSTEKNAFTEDDINVLGILADQVSLAIENARSFEQTRKSLEEAESLYRQFLQQQWASTVQHQEKAGYRFTVLGVTPITKEEREAGAAGSGKSAVQVFNENSNTYRMAVPIRVRDEVIAVLNVQSLGSRPWERDEIDIAQAAADRIALALENARLLEDSQRRAAKERIIGEISAKISASVDIESIFKTAAKELGLAISDSEVVVQFQTIESE
jgi:GAF domain-containing protein/HAMP domain-containing protein